jgi:glycine dehydrogenase
MVQDMTGLPIANASLLDEATAAAEAMLMCFSAANRKKTVFFVDERTFPQTLALLKTRAEGFGITVVVGNYETFDFNKYKNQVMGVLIQVWEPSYHCYCLYLVFNRVPSANQIFAPCNAFIVS